jgi:hypothetical protein
MKRVVLSLVVGSCLLVAAVAVSQTSVLVAQKGSDGQSAGGEKEPMRGNRICRDWPVYFAGNNALYYCDEWLNFSGSCDDDPVAAYEFDSTDATYPCDCSADSGDYACKDSWGGKKFNGLKEVAYEPGKDLKLWMSHHDAKSQDGTIVPCAARVVRDYMYINAMVPVEVGGQPVKPLPAIGYLIEVYCPNCTARPMKKFYVALECKPIPQGAKAATVNFDIAKPDQINPKPPYYAFAGKSTDAKSLPILLLTYTAVQP